ncbi:MAG: adenine methyltransferase, partial [Spirochaetales bacterium]|nr:adenine methyltransferase [Spirochaetales bacterium]
MALGAIDLQQDYLTRQLIAYIGNKRSLLPFLYEVFAELNVGKEPGIFIDPFAGSGSVSRLAKAMGFRVAANDWEPYTQIINQCHISLNAGDTANMFAEQKGLDSAIHSLNQPARPEYEYIARHYAPRDTKTADYRVERLFYTRENGVFIDSVREQIDSWYPDNDSPERWILLASLLYQAATHANTNGVFKAFHHGFGGFGKDALSRIMAPMQLQRPVLIDSEKKAAVSRADAAVFAAGNPADVCYLDPPYNQHQYGSNYHLLNTIVLWDKPEVKGRIGSDGRLEEKAGIRKDWDTTRSLFCYRATAPLAMRELLAAIDSRYIIVSYNTEGIIPFWDLFDLLAETGGVSIRTSDYLLYRGGKQSLTRSTYNQEFLFILNRSGSSSARERIDAERFLLEKKVYALTRHHFHPGRVSSRFEDGENGLVYSSPGGIEIQFDNRLKFILTIPERAAASLKACEKNDLYA